MGVAVGGQKFAQQQLPPSPPLPQRKWACPTCAIVRNPGKPGFRRGREQTEQGERTSRPRGAAANTDAHHFTWLALEPLTGRTHQLRVHCAAMGWPILGDSVYGSAPRAGGPGLHLHAREIVVPLYKNRAPIQVTAPVPPHMHERLRACGWDGETLKARCVRRGLIPHHARRDNLMSVNCGNPISRAIEPFARQLF